MPDVLELDLQLLVSHLMWVLRMELWASVRAVPLAVGPLLPFTQAFMWVLRFQVLMLAQLSLSLPMPSSALSPPRHSHPTLIWIVFLQLSVDGQRFRAHHRFPPTPLTALPMALVALRSRCSLSLCLTFKLLLPSKEGFFFSLSWSQARQQHTLNPPALASRVLALQMCASVFGYGAAWSEL